MNPLKKDLFDLFQLDKMSPEKADETLNRLAKLVFQSVLVRILPTLTKEQMEEYDRIVDSKENNGDELFRFLRDNTENFDNIIKEEAENLRIELTK